MKSKKSNSDLHFKSNRHWLKCKSSQTDILVTVLLVLIALAVVAIVAYFVVNQVRTSTSEAQLKSKNFEVYVKKAEIQDGFLKLSLERGSSNENFTGLKIVLTSSSGKSQTYNYTGYLNPAETQEISIPLNGNLINSGSIVADVYPVLIFNSETRIAPKTSGATSVNTNDAFDKSNLIAYWPFDSDAKDYSGNGNDGTALNGVLLNISGGKVGGAYQFDGVNDYIHSSSLPAIGVNNPFSMSCWFKTFVTFTYSPGIISLGAMPVIVMQTDGKIGAWWYDGISYPGIASTSSYNDGKYHFVLTNFNGTTATIYIDGIYQNSIVKNISAIWPGSNVGAEFNNGAKIFNGTIDEVRIYNRALSSEEVKALYDASK